MSGGAGQAPRTVAPSCSRSTHRSASVRRAPTRSTLVITESFPYTGFHVGSFSAIHDNRVGHDRPGVGSAS